MEKKNEIIIEIFIILILEMVMKLSMKIPKADSLYLSSPDSK